MSVNKLNLKIGGAPDDYQRRKVMREVSHLIESTDEELVNQADFDELYESLNAEEEFVVEEKYEVVEPEPEFVSEEVVYQEPTPTPNKESRVDRMAESISLYHTKTRQSLEEVAPVSDTDRIKLLEDAFAKMRRAQPQTLVSGIGASLDSGGGAVWLWDLDDVNIGTPSNGHYPVIDDNSILKYDSATTKWIVGSASDSGQDLPLSGGTMTGDIVFNTGQTFPGTLDIDGGTMTGDITFNSGQAFPGTLPLAGGTMTGDITFNSGQAFPGSLPLAGGAITGDTTYAGSTSGDTNLQTKASVNALIASGTGGNFVFKGTTDVTGTAPSSPAAGDFYINTVAGTADSSWTGIANSTISADQLIIYSGSESRWFAGAVENNSSYLLKTGGTMTGTLTISPTGGFLKQRPPVDALKDFAIQGSTLSAPTVGDGSLLQVYRNTLSDASVVDVVSYFGGVSGDNNIQTKSSVSALISAEGFLPKSGGTMTGTLTTDEVDIPKGKTLTIKRGNNNTSSSGLDIKGYAPNQVGIETDIFGVSYGNGTNNGDSINYKGRTDGVNNLQNKSSVQALISAAASTDGNILKGGEIKSTGGVSNTSGSLTITETGASGSGKLIIKDDSNAENFVVNPNGEVTVTKVTASNSLVVNNALEKPIHTLNTNGTAILGSGIEIGSANALQTTKAINLFGSSKPSLVLTTQASGESVQEIVSFSYNQTFFQTAIKVGPVGEASNFLLTTDGSVSCTGLTSTGLTLNGDAESSGSIKLTGGQAQTTAGTPNLSSDNNLIRFDSSQTGKAFFVKTGGINSSNQPNSHIYFYMGSTSTTSNVGIRYPVMTLGNQNGTYVASLGSSNAISSIRQTYDNEIVIMKTLSTTSLAVTSATTSTATETDGEGEVRNIVSQTAATVPSNVTFTGNNIHNGTLTHNGDFTVGTNHIISFNSPVFHYNGHYSFNGSTSNTLIQKIRNKGQASKVLTITATDASNAEQNILNIAHAGSEFFRPITVPTPTANGHAATKAYIDTLETKIADALNASSDYGAFKTALLAALG